MLKASRRNVVVFKESESKYFDEAHFIVRDNITAGEDDILSEANRIIAEYKLKTPEKSDKKKEKGSTFWFITGLLSGFSGVSLCMLLFKLLM